jgi:HSP20 family protein
MSLVKWNNDVNRFLMFPDLPDNFFNPDISDFLGNFQGTVPSVNIFETAEDYRIEMAVPGMAKEDLSVNLKDVYLIISGKDEDRKENRNDKCHRKEFTYHSFQRSFYLPDEVDPEKIEANYKDGILLVTLPKKEEVRKMQEVRTISIS